MGIASDFVLILIAALAGGTFARILRLPLLVGYVLAGIFVGSYTAGPRVVEVHDIELLAEIGVALLLFSLGLEVSFRDLRHVRNVALIGGAIQIVVTSLVGAAAATYGFGHGAIGGNLVWSNDLGLTHRKDKRHVRRIPVQRRVASIMFSFLEGWLLRARAGSGARRRLCGPRRIA